MGVAGYTTSSYVDLPSNVISVINSEMNSEKEDATFYNWGMHLSILESTTVQQTTGVEAVSTVSLIDKAVNDGLRIYNANANNYIGVVKPNLVNCSSYFSRFQAEINAGRRVIVPQNCNLTVDDWAGVGFYTIGTGLYLGATISGNLAGGFSAQPLSAPLTNQNTQLNSNSRGYDLTQYSAKGVFNDPIDMVNGNYLYENTDISVGIGGFPQSLEFNRLYSSGLFTQDGVLGKGWAHNLDMSTRSSSDGFLGMGLYTALDGVHTIVEILATHDLLMDSTKPLDKMIIASLSQRWFGERITNNTVVVRKGLNGEVFVKLPDGFYNPPPGLPVKLTHLSSGSFEYDELHHGKYTFDSSGKVLSYDDPSGLQVKFTYTGNNLTKIENSFGRTLQLTYSGTHLTQVSDGSRTVSYTYDQNGNLATYRNALNNDTNYVYDVPGRMIQLKYPSFPSTPAMSNTYDSLGRVKTQTNAAGKIYNYYFAGFRSEEIGPYNTSRVHYLDWQGNTLQQSDPLQHWIVSEYDGLSRLIKRTAHEGNSTTYTYDDATCSGTSKRCTSNITSIQQHPKPGWVQDILTQSFTYDPLSNKVATVTDARGNTTYTTYNSQLQPLSITQPEDANGVSPTTTYGYTGFNRLGWKTFYLPNTITAKTTASNNTVTTTNYNTSNRYVPSNTTLDSGSGKLNLTTSFIYDTIGNLTSINGPRTDVNDTTTYQYDGQRQLIKTINANGDITRIGYDADGRQTSQANSIGSQWMVNCTQYLPTGKPSFKWGPALTSGELICPATTDPVPRIEITYNDLDLEHTITQYLPANDGGNRITEKDYYLDGSLYKTKQALGTNNEQDYATYYYTLNGQLNGVQDANNYLTVYLYDGHDRLYRTHYPLPDTMYSANANDYEQFVYDENGNMILQRKRNAQLVGQVWDKLNRLVARNYQDPSKNQQFTYDLRGLRISARFANNSFDTTYNWDNAERLTSTTSGIQTLSFEYDKASNRTRLTWPDGYYASTEYDVLNRPVSIKENGLINLASFQYDKLSRRTKINFGNGTSTQYSYNNQGNLSGINQTLAGTAHNVSYSYTYNRVGEVTQTGWNNNLYNWDAETNTTGYTNNGLNQYTAVAGTPYTYDTNANLTSNGTWTYAYDADNRLISANKNGLNATLAYDAPGRLRSTNINSSISNLLYDDTNLVAEYNSSGTLQQRYIHGPGIDEPLVIYEGSGTSNKTWLHANLQGSIIARSNTSGIGQSVYGYGPFGEPTAESDTLRWRYTGQQYFPSLGLYYYKARWYSPGLGRFLQTDPIGYDSDLNLYTYAGNSPISHIDPNGENPVLAIAGTFLLGGSTDLLIQSLSGNSNNLNFTQAAFSGAAALAPGIAGANFARQAATGAISSSLAVRNTAVVGGASSAVASGLGSVVQGESPNAMAIGVSFVGGFIGTGSGAYIINSSTRNLEKMHNSFSPLLSGIASTTQSAAVGNFSIPTTLGQNIGSATAGFLSSYASSWTQNQFLSNGNRK